MTELDKFIRAYFNDHKLQVTSIIKDDVIENGSIFHPTTVHFKLLLSNEKVCVLALSKRNDRQDCCDNLAMFLEKDPHKNSYINHPQFLHDNEISNQTFIKDLFNKVKFAGNYDELIKIKDFCLNAQYFAITSSIDYKEALGKDLDIYTGRPVRAKAFYDNEHMVIKSLKLSHHNQVLSVVYENTAFDLPEVYVGFNPFEFSLFGKAARDYKDIDKKIDEDKRTIAKEHDNCSVIQYLTTLLDRQEAKSFFYSDFNKLKTCSTFNYLLKDKFITMEDNYGYKYDDLVAAAIHSDQDEAIAEVDGSFILYIGRTESNFKEISGLKYFKDL
ncbi:hypothetical protein DY052_07445 [Apilactobacillus timberlakei]|uniref:hypothetical protein n=1 Tax=Apilactobacillus timberlakei TaxID=2008380 RepID=UPI001129F304|nr:hypothetical protein [Apilactobacillus timberlakei]TPR13687.1 hypothetical protein DY052_07445 [Apilactobacillus timberlakei]